jgi:tetratricopeptide (TPR) repeat protein
VYIGASKIKEAEKTFEEIPIDKERGFRSNLYLHNGIFLDIAIDEYYSAMLEKVISTATSPQILIKAKYLYALHRYRYRWEENLSLDELRKLRDDLLAFVSEADTMPIPVYQQTYENLYSIASDLGDWINAIDYYREFSEYKADPPRIQQKILEGISKNQKQLEKLLALIEKHSSSYKRDPLVKIGGQFISFFFSKKKYAEVVELVEKFTFKEIMKTSSVFEVAYSYVEIDKQNLAKNYYRAYLEEKGNSAAVANNLALLEEKEGNVIEAERLLQLAIEWDPKDDIAKRNHKRVLERIQKENEKKRAYQRAVDLYQQEQESIRFFLARFWCKTQGRWSIPGFSGRYSTEN